MTPSDTILVITSQATCDSWLSAVEDALEEIFGEPLTPAALDLAFFRIGPYMAVSLLFIPPQEQETTLLQRSPLLIFNWPSKEYVNVLVM